jgi:hypothetical protein
MTVLIAAKAVIFIVCMLVGAEFFGVVGVLMGGAVSHFLFYFIEASVYRYYKLWIWELDFIFLLIVFCVAVYSFRGLMDAIS